MAKSNILDRLRVIICERTLISNVRAILEQGGECALDKHIDSIQKEVALIIWQVEKIKTLATEQGRQDILDILEEEV